MVTAQKEKTNTKKNRDLLILDFLSANNINKPKIKLTAIIGT
jgi:hypothetical protein